jgi:hypothetical protein
MASQNLQDCNLETHGLPAKKSIYLQFYESNCEAPEVQRVEHRILTPQAFFF